ncbi:metal-dependent amidase/aminoacylase/carboxypeptidase family protein [Mucilaginibacter sp. UYNi724]
MKKLLTLFFVLYALNISAQNNASKKIISTRADALTSKIIAWRRDFHEHPELGNREVRTSGIIAKHLQSLGIEVKSV